jgi:hypothetical protein
VATHAQKGAADEDLHHLGARGRPEEGSSSGCAAWASVTQEPVETGDVMTVVFDDTCGNLIQIAKA